jgi:hypothetical protein
MAGRDMDNKRPVFDGKRTVPVIDQNKVISSAVHLPELDLHKPESFQIAKNQIRIIQDKIITLQTGFKKLFCPQ